MSDVAARMRISHQIAEALHYGRLEVVYDPVVDLRTGDVVGLEAYCQARTVDGALIPRDEWKRRPTSDAGPTSRWRQ